MVNKKTSSRVYSFAKSAVSAAVLPVFLIYIMIDKPDYKIMNSLAHIVLPVANWVSDGVSWPVRAVGSAANEIRALSNLRGENKDLRIKLDEALKNQNICTVAIDENQKLSKELDIVQEMPQHSIVANIVHANKAFHHNTFFIDKGADSGIEIGEIVVSFDKMLIGTVSDVAADFSKIRTLNDSGSNIPVRIAGSEVYGFLRGNGTDNPKIGFFSDPEFQPTSGLHLITSKIRGILPDNITVGEMISQSDVKILMPEKISSVMILKFDNKNKYK